MDEPLMAWGLVVVLVVALVAVIWLLVMQCRKTPQGQPSTRHVFRGQGEAVTVAELVAEAKEQGEGVRLNWPEDDPDRPHATRPFVQDGFPTVILSKVGDTEELDDDWE